MSIMQRSAIAPQGKVANGHSTESSTYTTNASRGVLSNAQIKLNLLRVHWEAIDICVSVSVSTFPSHGPRRLLEYLEQRWTTSFQVVKQRTLPLCTYILQVIGLVAHLPSLPLHYTLHTVYPPSTHLQSTRDTKIVPSVPVDLARKIYMYSLVTLCPPSRTATKTASVRDFPLGNLPSQLPSACPCLDNGSCER